jgi:hypothetical protein
MRRPEGRWIFLSVSVLVAGALGALAIWAFAIRDGADPIRTTGPASQLTEAERESLTRLHLLVTGSRAAFEAGDLSSTCVEVSALVNTKPFGPFDTSSYPGGTDALPLSPLPGTAHWAAASDLERLRSGGWLLRQTVLRTLLRGDAGSLTAAVVDCHTRLLPVLQAATS